jgi:hypothetical protein
MAAAVSRIPGGGRGVTGRRGGGGGHGMWTRRREPYGLGFPFNGVAETERDFRADITGIGGMLPKSATPYGLSEKSQKIFCGVGGGKSLHAVRSLTPRYNRPRNGLSR